MKIRRDFSCLPMLLVGCASQPAEITQAVAAFGLDTSFTARRETAVDSLILAHMNDRQIAGAAVVVIQNGEMIKQTGYGVANLATREPATPSTGFFVASVSKIFTAVAVLTLVEDGIIQLDQPLGSILTAIPKHWEIITVRQLLSFVSGLPDPTTPPGVHLPTFQEVIDSLMHKPLNNVPGERYRYTQTNYWLLGKVVESVSGMSFEQFVSTRLLRPLDLKSPVFGDYRAIRPGVAEWYSVLAVTPGGAVSDTTRRLLRTMYPRYVYPAAGIHISAGDLAKFVAALAQGSILRPESVSVMWAPTMLNSRRPFARSFGNWAIDDGPPARSYRATGGARAAVAHYPDADLTIAVLTNTQGAHEVEFVTRLAAMYLGAGDH